MKTRRMMVLGKVKVKWKVKDEVEDDFCNSSKDPPRLGMPRPACRRDPYHGKAITPTSLELARYRAKGTATARTAPLPRR